MTENGYIPLRIPEDEFDATHPLGCVSYADWADYAWKNEIKVQSDRVKMHLSEIINDAETDHNPHHMLERAVSLSAFCMRRMIECRLITDSLLKSQVVIYTIPKKEESEGLEPFRSKTSGRIFENYDLKVSLKSPHSIKKVVNKIIHARHFAVLTGSKYLPDGIIISSDIQMKKDLFLFTPDEYVDLCALFINNEILIFSDKLKYDSESGGVNAT